jgi:hypothetical protein
LSWSEELSKVSVLNLNIFFCSVGIVMIMNPASLEAGSGACSTATRVEVFLEVKGAGQKRPEAQHLGVELVLHRIYLIMVPRP